jgi:hypothetical protein
MVSPVLKLFWLIEGRSAQGRIHGMMTILHNKCSYIHLCVFLLFFSVLLSKASLQKGVCAMSRLSIEVTPEQHQRLKAVAALSGMTIKEYVLARVLPPVPEQDDLSEEEALYRLEAFLKPRVEAAQRGEVVNISVEEIFAEARREVKP